MNFRAFIAVVYGLRGLHCLLFTIFVRFFYSNSRGTGRDKYVRKLY